jgi:hypothetical protein
MKAIKLIILLCIAAASMACENSQANGGDGTLPNDSVDNSSYIPRIAMPGNRWNELAKSVSLPPEYQYERTYVTAIGEDTLVDGITYYKVLTAYDSLSNVWEYQGLIREDTAKRRVYYSPPAWQGGLLPEVVLYDFQVQVGDTLQFYNSGYESVSPAGNNISGVVESVDSVLVKEIPRKRITIRSEAGERVHQWVEGLGDVQNGFLRGNIAMYSPGSNEIRLLCFYQNEGLIYKPTETGVDDCYVWKYINR